MAPVPSHAIHGRGAVMKHNSEQTIIDAVAVHFARRLTARCMRQLRSNGPKTRCESSHRCRRGELRVAAHAAINTNTVVGIPGTHTPTKASATHSHANAHNIQRLIPDWTRTPSDASAAGLTPFPVVGMESPSGGIDRSAIT